MKRFASILMAALLVAGLAPAPVFAAAPTTSADPVTTLEDTGATVTLTASDADGDATVSFAIDTPPTKGTLGAPSAPSCDGLVPNVCTATVTYTPDGDENGSDSFTFTATDATETSAPATADVTITAVNDAPSFTTGADELVLEDAGAQSVPGWATDLSTGPADESGQVLTFVIDGNTNPTLFSAGPAVSPDGTLSYTPVADANGSATITLHVEDDGGTADGGDDAGATDTFQITVTPDNDDPTANDDDLALDEDAGTTNLDVRANDSAAPDTGETLTVTDVGTAAKGTTAIVSASSVSYTPDADANGTDSFSYTISDGNGGTATATVHVTITAVNDAPSFTTGADELVLEDAGAQSVPGWATDLSTGPADESGQVLTFVIDGNTNPTLFSAGPAVSPDGTLSYTPVADANGSATITLHVEDDGGTADGGDDAGATDTFQITVTPDNDDPTANDDDLALDEDAGTTNLDVRANDSAAPDTGETLTVTDVGTAAKGTTAIVSASSVSYTPDADANGTDSFSYTISDGNGEHGHGHRPRHHHRRQRRPLVHHRRRRAGARGCGGAVRARLGDGPQHRTRRRERPGPHVRDRRQHQPDPVQRRAGGEPGRHPQLHPRRGRQRLGHDHAPRRGRRRHRGRRRRRRRDRHVPDHGHGRQRRAVVHQGRRLRLARGRRHADRDRLGDGDLVRTGRRSRPGRDLRGHRQHRPDPVRGGPRDRRLRHAHLPPGDEPHRHGHHHRADQG